LMSPKRSVVNSALARASVLAMASLTVSISQ
jgi:hypothetical protein